MSTSTCDHSYIHELGHFNGDWFIPIQPYRPLGYGADPIIECRKCGQQHKELLERLPKFLKNAKFSNALFQFEIRDYKWYEDFEEV